MNTEDVKGVNRDEKEEARSRVGCYLTICGFFSLSLKYDSLSLHAIFFSLSTRVLSIPFYSFPFLLCFPTHLSIRPSLLSRSLYISTLLCRPSYISTLLCLPAILNSFTLFFCSSHLWLLYLSLLLSHSFPSHFILCNASTFSSSSHLPFRPHSFYPRLSLIFPPVLFLFLLSLAHNTPRPFFPPNCVCMYD